MSLSVIIREVNAFRRGPKIDPHYVTVGDSIELYEHIDSQLSPEWLYQDGERPHYLAMKRQSQLQAAAQTLASRGFRPPSLHNFSISNTFPKKVSVS